MGLPGAEAMKRARLIDDIVKRITLLSSIVRCKSKNNLHSDNVVAENVYRDIYNIIEKSSYKNLNQEENNSAVYTGVYPYYYQSESDTLVTLPEKVVEASGTYDFVRILPLDFTSDYQEPPTESELRSKAQSYINSHDIGIPKVNLKIKFLEVDSFLERVDLCDTVSVRFEKLGVSATAKCIRTLWDVLRERYIEAELGSAKKSLAETIADSVEMEETLHDFSSQLETTARGISDKITGNLGGYIVLHDTNNDGRPDEILIMDTEDIATAKTGLM